jgi:N-acetyl-alpha-D-glucosaminyl L-malate synthase BshA
MKVGITCYPTFGGSGAIATELGLHLAERGHEVHFVSYAQPFRLGSFRERVFFHEVGMQDYPLFEHSHYTLNLAVAIHETARKHGLDLMHVHYAIPHATSAWIAREMLAGEAELPIVTTLHGTDITLVGMQPSFHSITRFSILRSQGITAVSSYLREETVRHFGVTQERIQVIPNFVDVHLYQRDLQPCHRSAFARPDEKLLMHVSNFRSLKRVVDVVEVFARVRARLPARLVMVGDGPDRPRALERAEELGVDSDVVFLGKHASVDELLRCADLFLLPSESESFGLAALEAMACGTPVVATRVGGVPEVVPHGEAGYLLAVGDLEGMSAAALELLSDKPRWWRASRSARAVAVERFSKERVVPEYERYYETVLGLTSGGERRSAPVTSPASFR